jgi:hypothetical protein
LAVQITQNEIQLFPLSESCRLVTKREAVEMLRKAGKDIPSELVNTLATDSPSIRSDRTSGKPGTDQTTQGESKSGVSERRSDREIIETLREKGRRLTTTELIAEMETRGLNPSESTVKKRLAELVKDKALDKDPNAKPRGYGLPEWHR